MARSLILLIVVMSVCNVAAILHKNHNYVKASPTEAPPPITEALSTPIPVAPEPQEKLPEFVEVPVHRQISETGTIYSDVISHSKLEPFGLGDGGRMTSAHETVHGIHSVLRNDYTRKLNKPVNGFYAFDGRGIIVDEPHIRKSHVNRFVPENLRWDRYQLYLVTQQGWDEFPLYLCDEWVAYIVGAKCGVDDVNNGRYNDAWRDGVAGCLEFSIYCSALAMAVKEGDPQYWKNNEQFKLFMVYMLKEANKVYLEGHRMKEFKWEKQDRLLKLFLTSDEAKPLRDFIEVELDGVWLDEKTHAAMTP